MEAESSATRQVEALRLLVHALAGAGRFAAARDLLLGLLAERPDDSFARRNLVHAHLGLGEYTAAEPLARELTGSETGPARAAAFFYHAHALWGLGRLEECRAAVERYAACLAAEQNG